MCFKTSRLHGFYNLSIFYLPPHFYHLLPCVFKTSRPSPTSAPWIFQPPNFLFASTILPFTSVCFQDFPYISDFDPIDLPTSKFPICLNIFTIHSRVFSRVPAYLQCSPRTLRTFTWWLSLVLPGSYVFASLHFDSLIFVLNGFLNIWCFILIYNLHMGLLRSSVHSKLVIGVGVKSLLRRVDFSPMNYTIQKTPFFFMVSLFQSILYFRDIRSIS